MKQFLRNLKKQKIIGSLNILGLSMGVMVAIIIGIWSINELSFDNFHKNGDHIYRSVLNMTLNDEKSQLVTAFKVFGEEALDKHPEIERLCRIVPMASEEIFINNIVHPNNKVFIADSNFFTFFSFRLVEGHAGSVLSSPDKAVISEKAAKKYFPGENAIGKNIKFEDNEFTISGIMKSFPQNSSMNADFIFPFFGYYAGDGWGGSDIYMTFFILNHGTDHIALAKELSNLYYDWHEFYKTSGAYIGLEPLREVHFNDNYKVGDMSAFVTGDRSLVNVFIIVAFIILLISCINFANLFVSTSFIRAKDIGIKKSQGAEKRNLVFEFYLETFFYVIISVIIGFFLAYSSIPIFNNFTNSDLIIDFSLPSLYIFIFILIIFTTLVAGSFPALYMTKFGIIETIKGKFKGKKISVFQKALIIFQYTASISLLICVLFIKKQVDFMTNQYLGFEKENVIFVYSRDKFGDNYELLRDELLKVPSISDITSKNSIPTEWRQGWPASTLQHPEELVVEILRIEPNYFDFFKMPIIAGENPFFLQSADTSRYCVINERAAYLLDLDQPVGEIVIINEIKWLVKGVVKDAQTRSFHNAIDPQIYTNMKWPISRPIFFKIKGDPQNAISTIRDKWDELVPDVPFEYHYLDDTYLALYKSENNTGKILTYAMLITFLITLVGLFAMAYYSIQRRIREIGLRKVNGASVNDLLILLNKDFIVWVLISFLIACPISYFAMKLWLENFIIKTNLSIWIFLLVGFAAFIIAIVTVSYQTWKFATTNPVNALKNE